MMLPARYGAGPSSVIRKSRLEGKPSLLPKPRRPGSTDRLSTDNPRPSTASHRSSSAEPSRGTFGAGRLSKEASATKLPLNGRSRSQTGEARYGHSNPTTTPLRSSHYSRPTTTPVRTPSEDRNIRSWQTSLERALAFVTIKDQRPISNVAWQRSEYTRVSELLAARGEGGAPLIRPLTIAKFVEVTGGLLAAINKDARLNTDNYVTKLPHLSKRLLYPGAVSKSWLRTVNTLHAFPHALALIGYLVDMLHHIEMPVLDEWLHADKDELAALRREYTAKCWIRFQEPDHQFEDLNEEHLRQLTLLLGIDEEKIDKLVQVIKKLEESLEDEAELAARADETRRRERHEALLAGVRAARAGRRHAASEAAAQRARRSDHTQALGALDVDIERASCELEVIRCELETQAMSVAERTRLLDDLDYLQRVNDSKRALADQIAKMVLSKETELALWQKRALDSCVEYKQRLIRLAAPCPHLARLAVDETDLMEASCAEKVGEALEALREQAALLAARRAESARSRTALCRKRVMLLEESRAKIADLKLAIDRDQQSLDGELAKEASEALAWSGEERDIAARLEALRAGHEDFARVNAEGEFWENQDLAWRSKLSELQDYVQKQREESQQLLTAARDKRVQLLLDNIKLWNAKIA